MGPCKDMEKPCFSGSSAWLERSIWILYVFVDDADKSFWIIDTGRSRVQTPAGPPLLFISIN